MLTNETSSIHSCLVSVCVFVYVCILIVHTSYLVLGVFTLWLPDTNTHTFNAYLAFYNLSISINRSIDSCCSRMVNIRLLFSFFLLVFFSLLIPVPFFARTTLISLSFFVFIFIIVFHHRVVFIVMEVDEVHMSCEM